MSDPATQIIYLDINAEHDLKDPTSEAGKAWSRILDLLEQHVGFRRLYWGRSPEEPSKVQLHVVRTHLSQHQDFLNSPSYTTLLSILSSPPLSSSSSSSSSSPHPLIRHAHIRQSTPVCMALSPSAPVTGPAIYLGTTATWHEGSWPLWTHIVRYVDGCLGCAGGKVVEPVDGVEDCFVVYVGWESVEKHERYHHTRHFEKRRFVLGLGNQGYAEYGHVRFEGERGLGEGEVARSLLVGRREAGKL